LDHSFIPGAPKSAKFVMASSQAAYPRRGGARGSGKVCPAVVRKVVGATSGSNQASEGGNLGMGID